MNRRVFDAKAVWLWAWAAVCTLPGESFACAVCFSDTESPMAKGVVAGVLVLVAVVGSVLFAMAGTGLYWMQRSRRISRTIGHEHAPRE